MKQEKEKARDNGWMIPDKLWEHHHCTRLFFITRPLHTGVREKSGFFDLANLRAHCRYTSRYNDIFFSYPYFDFTTLTASSIIPAQALLNCIMSVPATIMSTPTSLA